MRVHVDFETRSMCDIGRAGAWMYSRHYSTVILCVYFAVDDRPVGGYTFVDLYDGLSKEDSMLARFIRNNPDAVYVAHNSKFEYAMWLNKMVPLGFPEIPLGRWECTAARARVMNLPASLENAGAALKLKIQKDDEGYKAMIWLCKPQKLPKIGRKHWQDLGDGMGYDNDPAKFQKLFSYCATDVEVERLLDNQLKPMGDFEHAVWLEDQRMNLRGIRVDLELVNAALDISARLTEAAVIEISQLTSGVVTSFTQRERLHDWLIAKGVVSDRLRADDVEEMLSRDNVPLDARRVLEIRRSMAKSSIAKYELIRDTADTDERVRDYLLYGGAHTLRWSGQGIQVQNFPRGAEDDMDGLVAAIKTRDIGYLSMLFGDPNHALSNALRGVFIPSEGKELIWADYAAIEARVLMWLADCEVGLQMFRDGVDIYVEMAKRIFQNPSLTKANKFERQLGKKAVLGCGYQMGGERFQGSCVDDGIDIERDLADDSVSAFRAMFPEMKIFWYALEAAAGEAVRNQCTVWVSNKIAFGYKAGALIVRLPSGRLMYYHQPKISTKPYTAEEREQLIADGKEWKVDKVVISAMIRNEKTRQWQREYFYGGKFAENITQAVARDIMANGFLNAARSGVYDVLMLVHDEAVTESEIGKGSPEELEYLLCKLPDWAIGCPIKAEGVRGFRYKK